MTPTEQAAQSLALWAHAGQRYGDPPDDVPYISHCADVVAVLREHGIDDPAVLAAAWLHDALEDTVLPPDRIERQCGPRVLALVRAVTDSLGATRAERKMATLPRVRATGRDAVAVKLADRIANVRAGLASPSGGKVAMYRAEQPAFFRALHDSRDALAPLWSELRTLLGS